LVLDIGPQNGDIPKNGFQVGTILEINQNLAQIIIALK